MPDRGRELSFKVHGMSCAEEVDILKREIGPMVGGEGRLSHVPGRARGAETDLHE